MKPINPIQRYVEQTFDAIDKAMQIAVDLEVPDNLLAQLAHAHVGATRTEMVMHSIDVPGDAERVYADEARKQLPIRRDQFEAAQNGLPALQKQPTNPEGYKLRPGIGKKLRKPIEYACYTCGAQPDELCFQMSSQGKHGVPLSERKKPGTYHQARYTLSKAANTKLRAQYDREHYGDVADRVGGTELRH
jgi:hypothetical protein